MNIWLITDTHFNHKKLIEYGRPEDYEERIQRNMGYAVMSDDLIIHLGDVALKKPAEAHEDFISEWKGRKWLVLGNHDHNSYKWYLNQGWDAVAETMLLKRFGKRILFSHKPQEDLGYFDVNIHGHFHDDTHRSKDFQEILNEKHKLLAIEHTDYGPVSLDKFLE